MADVKLTLMEEERAIVRSALAQMKGAAVRNAAKAVVPELKAAHDRLYSKVSALLQKMEAM